MKPILIISHNTKSAGTLNVTLNLFKFLLDIDVPVILTLPSNAIVPEIQGKNLKVIKCNNTSSLKGIINRILFDLFVIPFLIFKEKPKLIIGLANYFINLYRIPSRLIIRHPYLLESKNQKFLSKKEKVLEFFRQYYFKFSVKTATHIFLQSDFMHELFIQKFPEYKNVSSVLPNPISPYLEETKIHLKNHEEFLIIYPSRYYPHKNHQFIINLAVKYHDYFEQNQIRFLLTIDKNQKSSKFILDLIEMKNVSNLVKNLGEIHQSELFKVYEISKAIIFPSFAETFGNGLIEGLSLQLPVIAPDLPYTKTILGNAGAYYENNNLDSAFNKIHTLITDSTYYDAIIEKSKVQLKRYPNLESWWSILVN